MIKNDDKYPNRFPEDKLSRDLWGECDTLSKEFFNNSNEYPQSTLYHYTNFLGLEGILKSGTLWLSSYACLNDQEELRFPIDQVINCIEQGWSGLKNQNWINSFKDILEIFNVYICSFCQSIENKSLWEKYGDNSKGFAIGFRKEFFAPRNDSTNSAVMLGCKVHYNNSTLKSYINKLVRLVKEKQIDKNEDIATLIVYLLYVLPRLKKCTWKDENEYRLSMWEYTDVHNMKISDFCDRVYVSCRFPVTRNGVTIPTTKIDFDKHDITAIYLGCNSIENEEEIRSLLNKFNYPNNIQIVKSKCKV